jgi:hypothetical protein
MRIITRTKVTLGVTGLVLALAVQGFSLGHAASTPNGTLAQFGTDITLTTSATGVTSSQAFPGGGTTAGCFIQVTTKSDVQTATSGACTGITLTVTCASNAFNNPLTADGKGSGIINGANHTNAGAYDTGGCPAAATNPPGITPTSSVTLSGYTVGSTLVFYINNDAQASRDGCFQYYEGSGTGLTTQQCFANTAAGNDGAFYSVVAQGTSGILVQTKGPAAPGSSGNLTIGGVFIVPAAATTPAATATAGTPAATATVGTPAATATATAAGGGPPAPPTFQPTAIGGPPGPPTNTPTITPTPLPTDTPTPVPPTATTAPVNTVPTPTPKPNPPKKTATPVPTTPPTVAPPKPTTKPVHVTKVPTVAPPPTVPPTGAGGTYVYSSTGATRLSHAALTSAAPANLPQTGGADGGGFPTSPLAPLALLGAVAIVAGRAVRKLRK